MALQASLTFTLSDIKPGLIILWLSKKRDESLTTQIEIKAQYAGQLAFVLMSALVDQHQPAFELSQK